MNHKSIFVDMMMAFFICTACITILEGVLGMIFFPQVIFGYEAFFSPPLFGIFSVLFSIVNYSRKELSVRQVLFRRFLHLLMIEALVLGLNYKAGEFTDFKFFYVLAFSVALVFILVYVVMWMGERYSAMRFNEQLKVYQSRQN